MSKTRGGRGMAHVGSPTSWAATLDGKFGRGCGIDTAAGHADVEDFEQAVPCSTNQESLTPDGE
jgi:hypothetical protein